MSQGERQEKQEILGPVMAAQSAHPGCESRPFYRENLADMGDVCRPPAELLITNHVSRVGELPHFQVGPGVANVFEFVFAECLAQHRGFGGAFQIALPVTAEDLVKESGIVGHLSGEVAIRGGDKDKPPSRPAFSFQETHDLSAIGKSGYIDFRSLRQLILQVCPAGE
jgi:hypothetical protein